MTGAADPPRKFDGARATERSGPRPGTRAARIVCERCGAVMFDRHCKVVCPNCGYLRDCSDP